jgi:hypothetical protein
MWLISLCAGCDSGKIVPGGEIILRNDIADAEYNVVVVDQLKTATGMTSWSVSLRPGDEVKVPYKKVEALRFSRRYRTMTRVYKVECPKEMNRQVLMKLINVHLNKIGGGCTLVDYSER